MQIGMQIRIKNRTSICQSMSVIFQEPSYPIPIYQKNQPLPASIIPFPHLNPTKKRVALSAAILKTA